MKILFIQLPLLDHTQGYLLGNIDYAPASLAAFITKNCPDAEIALLPRVLSLFGSDRHIVRYIVNSRPDVVAFTAYLWNIERSLNIAGMVKKDLGSCSVFFGGPEIAPGSWALSEFHPEVDCFVSGEGEWFFAMLLSGADWKNLAVDMSGNRVLFQPQNALIPVQDIVEPFQARYLNPMPDGSIFMEMTRGCPYRCSYCYYSKNCPGLRELPFEVLTGALAARNDLAEIYILSPTFDRTPDFRRKLAELARINRGVSLHTEMRADRVDAETARLIYDAGFHSLEVGLQSLNKAVLEKVRRGSDPERELQGMLHLKRAGIDLKIGIIPGLPGDTPESFTGTIDRLVDAGLGEHIELYPLMVLPGTSLRDTALNDNIDYLPKPPYYYVQGWGFDFTSLREIIWYTEARTGFSHAQRRLPDFTQQAGGMLTGALEIDGDIVSNWDAARWSDLVETSVFTIFIRLTDVRRARDGFRRLRRLFGRSELFNIVVFCENLLPDSELDDLLEFTETDIFYQRLHFFDQKKDGCPLRFYQVFNRVSYFKKALACYTTIEPVIRLSEENFSGLIKAAIRECNILIPSGFYHKAEKYLIKYYSELTELVAFENEDEQKLFYEKIGFVHVSFPFSFAKKKPS
ncbi:MAG TPA: radical SAM protein [Spirochaetota bacterium]|nr:radical SAM protein [Spirochaetota bacterium]HPI88364.1 radical SAM protein [Spirochaetota bacterium]HPR46778.1 radical SAM protein [Spirochaetota bacterium]